MWQKFPQNPVVTASGLGLEEIGRPAVLAEGGELRMWIDGREPGTTSRAIFELRNTGRLPEDAAASR